jgi:hypothetical protein
MLLTRAALRWAGWKRVGLLSGGKRCLTGASRLGVFEWLQRWASQARTGRFEPDVLHFFLELKPEPVSH